MIYKNKTEILVSFIGGEPLLDYNIVINISQKVLQIANKYNVSCAFVINTNGSILKKEVISDIKNANFSITLSLEEDHNKNRPGKGFNPFDKIISGINECSRELTSNGNSISLRYNVNEENVNQFND
ncbi:MAG: hypothetical protein MSH08_03905 [Ezakiella sp.]|nr:hypothetical protein [Ezakiella sp.]MDD7471666.1 hypothetical protein [Bacillota bacterium]MDY3923450.1 hypothetical protein [Ezakiella sp.]